LPALIAAAVIALAVILTAVTFLITLGGDHDALYDDPEALRGKSSYSAFQFSNLRTGDSFSGSVGKLSGIYEVFSCTVETDGLAQVHYTLDVTNGKAKLVLVSPDGAIATLQECLAGESADETVTVTLPEGVSRFKLVGAEEAAFSWKVELK